MTIISRLSTQPTNIKFDQIGLEQGLSQSTVYAITQDKQGFMWFGTQDGLNRYDGYSIKVFKHDPNDSNSISDNTIWSLLSDSKGDLWIGTERGGLNRYVPSENRFYRYVHKEGDSTSISEDFIVALFEDSRGNIWVGTRSMGLNLFPARRNQTLTENKKRRTFLHFLDNKKNSGNLSGNSIREICEDNIGNLWVASQDGLYKLNLDEVTSTSITQRFIEYRHIPSNSNSLSSNNIRTLYCDPKGILYIGTSGGGLNSFDPKTDIFKRYLHDAKNPASISGSLVTSIYEDFSQSEQVLWIGTYDGGLNLYNSKTDNFDKYIKTENVLTLYEDRTGVLWIGTLSGGIKAFDRRKSKFIHYFDDLNNPKDLYGNIVSAILVDGDSELWVATLDYGLNHFDRQRKTVKVYSYDSKNDHSLGNNIIVAVCESRQGQGREGNIWVASMSGGLGRFDKKRGKFIRYKHDSKNPNSVLDDNISALYHDEQSEILWIGYSHGGISSYNFSKNVFTHFLPDKKNPYAISSGAVSRIYRGKQSGLWVGTIDRGLNRFVSGPNLSSLDQVSFKHYQGLSGFTSSPNSQRELQTNQSGQESVASVNNNGIQSIYEDNEGIVWIGTYGGGLNRYNPMTDSFTYYTTKNGLPNDVVYGILPDNSGNLWLSTNYGISRFNPKTETFRNFDVRDGLQGNEFNQGAYFASSNGELFFGGVNGFNSFFPEDIEENEYVPLVYLTTFKVFDEIFSLPNPIPDNTNIELSHSQNFFSFEFVALNYTAPGKNQYAYILEGFDKNWHFVAASNRYASYTNLDPGEYILRVKGSNNDGVWNERGTSITVIVNPPYWMTWWFRVLLILVIGGILYTFYKMRLKRFLELERLRIKIASDLHDDIGAALTRVTLESELLKSNSNNEERETAIEKIGTMSREIVSSLSDIVWSIDSRNDSIEDLFNRMKDFSYSLLSSKNVRVIFETYNLNLQKKLKVDIRQNIYLIFKEALNNTVKYSNSEKLKITLKNNNGKFIMIIDDPETNFTPQKLTGQGLRNMQMRAERIGGNLEFINGSGLKIIFTTKEL